ncbi:DUF2510 domain-containing protein [Microbacterium sp. LTA6]|uniref:hypothetical protein n=1 Tax=Microbacterium sp. LTA6 TaxID=3129771 RepID=UPI0032559DC6
MSMPAGWYPNGDDWETFWDGTAWTDQHRSKGPQTPPPPAPPRAVEEVAADQQPLLQFTSHIQGKNAVVTVWPDRVEWLKPRGVSGGKITAGVLTGGLSMLATGVKNGKTGTEMIPIKSISSVTTKKDGFSNTLVSVITTGNTIDFRVSHKEAAELKQVLTQLILSS